CAGRCDATSLPGHQVGHGAGAPAPGRVNPRSAAAEPSAELSAAIEHGRICALAAECQRDLQDDAAAFPGLFPPSPFDARLFSTVALANAFGSPWETRERLRTAARTSLWVFAADWAVDHKATTR